MSTARKHSRSLAWLRVLAVLLALLTPGPPRELSTAPVAAAEITEYDVLDAALRPASGVRAHRPAAPLRPAPLPSPATGAADRPRPAPPGTPYALHTLRALRTVVLRC